MSTNQTQTGELDDVDLVSEVEEDEDGQEWGDWNADDDGEGDGLDSDALLCLFCDLKHGSSEALFEHCSSTHRFDFSGTRKTLGLDFYGCFKFINYVRSQVAENRCWSCGFTCQSKQDLQNHAHEAFSFKDSVLPWGDDRYLKPFMQEDPLLYSFGEEWVVDDEDTTSDNKITELSDFEKICIDDDNAVEGPTFDFNTASENGRTESASAFNSCLNGMNPYQEVKVSSVDETKVVLPSDMNRTDKVFKISAAKMEAEEIKSVNKNYFGLYSSFGIHREMISDKVRTDAYRQALINNPSLLRGATVLDVGCGTGILSLFACQAGASSVIAVEASEKMAAVATQIAKDNGLLCSGVPNEGTSQGTGVMKVVQGMVEELVNCEFIQPHSIDVLLSEWMGYCLLYESMLSSVLLARDRWLKPGGAILPDTATMFVAGFGKGGTCIPFWETVYGFNMSCVGKELVEDAARIPMVDVIDSGDIVTNTGVLQSFDLVKMTPDDMDFTSTVKLEPLADNPTHNSDSLCKITWCYGIVLWFETGFTSRFCKDMPIVLSTSPYTPVTHWSQTILTFREPIAISSGSTVSNTLAAVGTDACPAAKVHLRISIARPVAPHRSIDISLEIAAIAPDGRKRSWPVQIFNLS